MKKIIQKFIPTTILLKKNQIRKVLKKFLILNKINGQWESRVCLESINADRVEVPWYTYPAIKYLENFDFNKDNILEFGGGNSTIWWSKKDKNVVAIEDNEFWYDNTKATLPKNILHQIRLLDEYSEKIEGCFDVVITDDINRYKCVETTLKFYKPKMIIFDSSDRYPETLKKIRKTYEWPQIDFSGFALINSYIWTTTIFFNKINDCLEYIFAPKLIGGEAVFAQVDSNA